MSKGSLLDSIATALGNAGGGFFPAGTMVQTGGTAGTDADNNSADQPKAELSCD